MASDEAARFLVCKEALSAGDVSQASSSRVVLITAVGASNRDSARTRAVVKEVSGARVCPSGWGKRGSPARVFAPTVVLGVKAVLGLVNAGVNALGVAGCTGVVTGAVVAVVAEVVLGVVGLAR